ncbi:MAG: hypothetical protein QOJ83_2894 [Frankiales bacterium]|jgi:uncharacterized membrane protein|nr:hypothetical protein [Frankiales bacterium]
MRDVLLVLAVFAACVVESVEALTIVLAVGVTRGWKATLRGVTAGLVALAVIVAALGPALTVIPITALRLVVGGLLLVFGLGWLRKAILRASGFKALHDETAIFARQRAAAEAAGTTGHGLLIDPYAFTLAFKGVLLEGLEVAFIVLTFGANQNNIGLASVGAVAAVVLVTGVGIAVRAPLARVPENTLKFVVGVLLTSFGTFWGVEGAGATWPGSDAALLGVIAFVAAIALAAVWWLRQVHDRQYGKPLPTVEAAELVQTSDGRR